MGVGRTNINFTSRSALIKKADAVARSVKEIAPHTSISRVFKYKNISQFPEYKYKLVNDMYLLREDVRNKFNMATDDLRRVRCFILPMKNAKVGNCSEEAQLASVIAQMNGLKGGQIKSLQYKDGTPIDHVALYFENNGKPFVIDPWLNFADYLPNAMQRYTGEYADLLDLSGKKAKDIDFVCSSKGNPLNAFASYLIPDDVISVLRVKYPQVIR